VTVLIDVDSIPSVLLKHSDISTIRNLLGTRLDVAGTLWRHRTFYDDRLVHEHEKWVSSPTPHRGEVGAEARLTGLQVPRDLLSAEPDTAAAAWNSFRGEFALAIRKALQCGVAWRDLLTSLLMALSRQETGHPRLAQYVKSAVCDRVLTDFPVLHADVLLWKLDSSFGNGTAEYAHDSLSADWERAVSRLPGEDAVTLAERVIDAYVKKQNDPRVDQDTVWLRNCFAHEINERYSDCLFEDLGCPPRGAFNQYLFNREWLTARARYDMGEIPIDRTSCVYIARVYIMTNESAAALCGFEPSCATDASATDCHPLPPIAENRPAGRGARERRIESRKHLRLNK
jgi:hypothetical protein